jgi:hypothetical protein
MKDGLRIGTAGAPVSIVLPVGTAHWTLFAGGTLTGYTNAANAMHLTRIISGVGTDAGYLAHKLDLQANGNYLPGFVVGGVTVINCDKGWRVRFALALSVGSAGYRWGMMIGGVTTASTPGNTTLVAKGWGFCIIGTGTGTATIEAQVHNGSAQTLGNSAALTNCDGRVKMIEVIWTPASGLTVSVDGVIVSSATTGLPSGTITGSANGWHIVAHHVTPTVATHQCLWGAINVTHLP